MECAARGSNDDGWVIVSERITTTLADDRAPGTRWPTYEVAAAHKVQAARIEMVEQPLSINSPSVPEAAAPVEWKAGGGSWDWQATLNAEQLTKGYHSDLAIRAGDGEEDLSSGMSEGDMDEIGDNPERPEHGSEKAGVLRGLLLEFATEAERIKGNTHGADARQARWNK